MLPRLARLQPAVISDLVRRVEDREFDVVALTRAAEGNDEWWRDYHLGQPVISALRRSYRFDGQADGYYVYVPGPGS